MPKLKTLSIVPPALYLYDMLGQVKQYASVADESRDGMLTALVQAAVLRVQEFADTALVATRLELTATPDAGGRVRLYEGGGAVESVQTEDGSQAVPFSALGAGAISVQTRRAVRVVYVTAPEEGEQVRLKPVVYRYATALYDGLGTDELNAILNEAL